MLQTSIKDMLKIDQLFHAPQLMHVIHPHHPGYTFHIAVHLMTVYQISMPLTTLIINKVNQQNAKGKVVNEQRSSYSTNIEFDDLWLHSAYSDA